MDRFAQTKIEQLAALQTQRHLPRHTRVGAVTVERQGRRFVSFSCNDLLGLAHHPDVQRAAKEAIDVEGTGAGASRLVTGNGRSLQALEGALSTFRGTERTLVFGSGSLLNMGLIPAVVGEGDLVILDERAHASLMLGARLSRAEVRLFAHNAPGALRSQLQECRAHYRHVVVAVEGVYSMDGDLAPLPEIVAACDTYDAWLLVDDAHAIGVLGGGRGSAAHFGLDPAAIPLYVATLSKAFGSYGAAVGTSAIVADLLTSRARTLVYSTGLPPASAAAAAAALDIIQQTPALCDRPHQLAQRFAERTGSAPPSAHLVPLIVGIAADALAAQQALEAEGYLVTAIRPPTVAVGTSRLRVSFSAAHSEEDVDGLARAWLRVKESLGPAFNRTTAR